MYPEFRNDYLISEFVVVVAMSFLFCLFVVVFLLDLGSFILKFGIKYV